MKIYFSTTSHDIPKAKRLMKKIRDNGHEITYDWTIGMENESLMDQNELMSRAVADIEGVREADIVIVYMQEKMTQKMTGVAIEMGAAFVLNKNVAVIEEEAEFTHFFQNHSCFSRWTSMDQVMRMLIK